MLITRRAPLGGPLFEGLQILAAGCALPLGMRGHEPSYRLMFGFLISTDDAPSNHSFALSDAR